MRANIIACFLIASSGCANGDAGAHPIVLAADSAVTAVDDAGQRLTLSRPARRVISLIPSATETIVALGGAEQIVGRTRYDVAPQVAERPLVGGTLDPSIEAILELKPDFVITWEHDKRQLVRRRLSALGVPTFSIRTVDTNDVFRGMERLGHLLGRDSSARAVTGALRAELAAVQASVIGRVPKSVFFVVFNDPPLTAGPRTFIGELITIAGGRTIFPEVQEDWPTVALEEVLRRQPEIIVLPFGDNGAITLNRLRASAGWREMSAVRQGRVVTIPADLLSRPGPNIAGAARALRDALHPDIRGHR